MTTPARPSTATGHRWRFFRAGGFDQAMIETGADLMALEGLDQKLWVALSCPASGIEFDPATLALVDSDGDGHIRPPEILEAVRWAGRVLRDPETLAKRQDRLPLSAVADGTEEGRAVLAGSRLVLTTLGKAEAAEISLADAADTAAIFERARWNGDGVVPPASIEDAGLKETAEAIVACLGGPQDRSGAPGVTAETIERFFAEGKTLDDWRAEGEKPEIRPFGDRTVACHALFVILKAKVADYFSRCRLAAYDGRAAALLLPSDAEYQRISLLELGTTPEALRTLPIAIPGSGRDLPLSEGLNPAWAGAVRDFAKGVVGPVLGELMSLSEDGWAFIAGRFAAYEAWLAARPATAVESIDPARLREILSGNAREGLLALVAKDKAVAPEVDAIASVERILRYCRDLHLLVNNFVSFRDFYTRKGKATFQAGTLYLDGRSCDLCVPVADAAAHAGVAALSRVYLVYCHCVRRGGGEKATIAAAVTAGDSDQLMVGRNGVFYDRKGRDWDATIVRIVEHPIGLRQAFWGPYKRVARMVGEQFQKFAAGKAKAAEEQAGTAAVGAAEKAAAGKPPAPATPFDVGKFAGIFAAIGLALGAIGTAVAAMVTGLLRLAWWQIPIALAGIVLAISGPAVLLAWFKLRSRNLGPILDANGWAVNARAKINIPFGASLTQAARLPENAERSLTDPFAEKKSPWKAVLILIALVSVLVYLWREGHLPKWLGWH